MNKTTAFGFVAWWMSYPRKVGKKTALIKWLAALKEISTERKISVNEATDWLLERTEIFAASDKGLGDFCPYPTKWLDEGRYDDDVDEWNDHKLSDKPKLSDKSRRSIDAIGEWLEGKQ